MKIKKEYIINLKGKNFITFAGLLAMAHENGLTSLISTPVFEDHEKGIYIFRAVAIGIRNEREVRFEDEGDAFPYNVGKMIKPHIRRMASTRAMARTLRLYNGIGMCSIEEII
tara:strand:+ start:845 stop:1183 length:339 start_codon:yes stop_codon:yes gene_type:complete